LTTQNLSGNDSSLSEPRIMGDVIGTVARLRNAISSSREVFGTVLMHLVRIIRVQLVCEYNKPLLLNLSNGFEVVIIYAS
jgi:hypothetical protein